MKTKIIIEKYTLVSSKNPDCEVIKVSTLTGKDSQSIEFRYQEENGKVKCI